MSKDTNANTITHYVGTTLKHVKRVVKALEEEFPNAEVSTRKVALVSACGSDMKVPGILARSVKALADKEISVLAIHQCMRQVDRKSTRLNSSHVRISYAVFCLKKKNKKKCSHTTT